MLRKAKQSLVSRFPTETPSMGRAQSALCSVAPGVLSTVLCSTTVSPGIHCCCGCGSCFCCCSCHFGGVAQETFLQKWHAPSRQSQLLQSGVLCPWTQLSDGIHVTAMQSPSPESVSQKRPVTWPQSAQARSKSDSSPYANTSRPSNDIQQQK